MISSINNTPLLLMRKQAKKHGIQHLISGTKDREVVVIEDVITSGKSVIDACKQLEKEGYTVKEIISIVYRGNQPNMTELGGYKCNYLFTLQDLLDTKPIIKPVSLSHQTSNQKTRFLLDIKEKKKSSIILAYEVYM